MTASDGGRMIDHRAEAERILAARREHRTLDPISDRLAIDMDDAYTIQSMVVAAWSERGERPIGWKLGYTSLAMRAQMGIDQPNYGPLTDAMVVADGGDVTGRFTQPRVEPEVALRFARDVDPEQVARFGRDAVLDAVASACIALEIVDSVWAGYRFRIEDNTADGSSAAGVVLGAELALDQVADVEVGLVVDGVEIGRGVGRDASGHPADGVVWLVEQLERRDRRLRAGEVVITGGLTAAAALVDGSTIEAVVDGVVAASVHRASTTVR